MKKLLLVSVSTGSGHVRAAEALKASAKKWFPGLSVEHIDFIDYVSLPMKAAVLSSYDILVKQAPELWGFFYHQTNSPAIQKLKPLTKTVKKINSSKYFRYIEAYQPDYILFTHFLPADIFHAAQADKSMRAIPAGMLITDYGFHELLLTSKDQDYFVTTDKVAWDLEQRGIEKKRITASGMPVDPSCYTRISKRAARAKLGLPLNKKIVLCMSGGHGLTDLTSVVTTLFESKEPLHVVAIAGHNMSLQRALAALPHHKQVTLSVHGWIDTMPLYMRAADAVVGKVGGMTMSECLAIGTPLIGIDPIPGQEEENAQYLLEMQAGSVAKNPHELLYYVTHLPKRKATSKKTNAAKQILSVIQKQIK